jgi:SAM-dependent methyltransferase
MVTCPVCSTKEHGLVDKYGDYSLLRCSSCSVIFSEPMRSPGPEWYEQNKFYQIERRYLLAAGDSAPISRTKAKDEKFLENIPCSRLKLLDIGCGKGDFLEKHRKDFASVTGVDFDSEAIKMAKAKGLEVYCMEIDKFLDSFTQSRFDIITIRHVLEHVEEPSKLIESVRKVLSPGGLVVVSVPNADFKLVRPEDNKIFLYPPHHLTLWSTASLKNLFELHRYEVCKMDSFLTTDDINDFVSTLFIGAVYSTKKILLDKKRSGLLGFLRAFKRGTISFLAVLGLPLLRLYSKEGSIILCVSKSKL